MKILQSKYLIFFILTMLLSAGISFGQSRKKSTPDQVVFKNVRVFDGTSDALSATTEVLVEGNKIKEISSSASRSASKSATIIDGNGRVLMPGLSDTHTHLAWATVTTSDLLFGHPAYVYIKNALGAEAMLMRGITTVRDMGGNTFGLKKAIDEGVVPGPRIYPAGATLSQTGGHGDFRFPNSTSYKFGGEKPGYEKMGQAYIVDGVPDVLTGARENLRLGSSHIKLAAGGGYASPADPLLGNQFTFEEMKAAVDAATDWGTYVTIHAYHVSSINRAIDAGVKDIGHGHLLDEATMRRMAKEGVFLSSQPFTTCHEPQLDDFSNEKLNMVCQGTDFMYATAKKIPELKVTYGTDLFFVPPDQFATQVKQMERLLKWYEPFEILKMATGTAGELYKMSGMRNPYPGDLGVMKEGAYADILLVEGNPLEDLGAVTNTDNLLIIMKDGKIYKNTL